MLRYLVNCLLFVLPPTRLFYLRQVLLRVAGVHLGSNVRFCGHSWIYGRGHLSIGDNTWISHGCRIFTHLDAPIEIGKNTDIGPNVLIIVGTHQVGSALRRAGCEVSTKICIGDGCWLGSSVTVLDGVFIPNGCIVGAGSTVTQSVYPPSALLAGAPTILKKIYHD